MAKYTIPMLIEENRELREELAKKNRILHQIEKLLPVGSKSSSAKESTCVKCQNLTRKQNQQSKRDEVLTTSHQKSSISKATRSKTKATKSSKISPKSVKQKKVVVKMHSTKTQKIGTTKKLVAAGGMQRAKSMTPRKNVTQTKPLRKSLPRRAAPTDLHDITWQNMASFCTKWSPPSAWINKSTKRLEIKILILVAFPVNKFV